LTCSISLYNESSQEEKVEEKVAPKPKAAAKKSTAPAKSAVKVTANPLDSPASTKKRARPVEIAELEVLDSDEDDSHVEKKPER
jgi:hypothetical protein